MPDPLFFDGTNGEDIGFVDRMVAQFAETGRPVLPQFVLLMGLPGSGKTTWAEAWVADDIIGRARVNKDDLRGMLHGGVYKGVVTESIVNMLRNQTILALLLRGTSVVCDDTNLDGHAREELLELARSAGAMVVVVLSTADVPLEECIRRDSLREKAVGADVIRGMHAKYLASL